MTFLAYIWEDGRVSERFLAALVDRARRGVEVRLLLDAFGAIQAPGEGLAGAGEPPAREVAYYRPARFGMLTRFHRRNHRRAIVVDGAVGFTGGAAVGDKWAGRARNPEEWRDSMVRVTGPPARSLQVAFAQSWTGTHGPGARGPPDDPPPHARGRAAGAGRPPPRARDAPPAAHTTRRRRCTPW